MLSVSQTCQHLVIGRKVFIAMLLPVVMTIANIFAYVDFLLLLFTSVQICISDWVTYSCVQYVDKRSNSERRSDVKRAMHWWMRKRQRKVFLLTALIYTRCKSPSQVASKSLAIRTFSIRITLRYDFKNKPLKLPSRGLHSTAPLANVVHFALIPALWGLIQHP